MNSLKLTPLASIITALFLSLLGASARTWTSADESKTFEGELLSYDEATGNVGVTLANGKEMVFNQDILSKSDIAFLSEKGNIAPPTDAPTGTSGDVKELPKELPKPDAEPADMSKPVQVYILMGQSNMLGLGNIASLEAAVKEGKYPYIADDSGAWTERKDVRNVFMMTFKLEHNDWMSVTNRNKVGPEYGIGHTLGAVTDAPVMILKSCIGNRSLGWDLLPPGSEPYEFNGKMVPGYRGTEADPKGNGEKPSSWYAGKQYDDDVEGAKQVLSDLDEYYPGAKGYEIAGFFFWQGDKDRYNHKVFGSANAENYEKNLVHLIKALRKDFDAPNAKFVVATLGQTVEGAGGNDGKILEAQMAVDGEKGKYDEFKGNVSSVYTNPFCHGGASNGHYGGNSETYMDIGEAMGRAMAELIKK